MSSSKVIVKIISYDKKQINKIQEQLKKKGPDVSFFRLPKKTNKIVLRGAVSGRGYATFVKYKKTLYRGICCASKVSLLNTIQTIVNKSGVYSELSIL